jgi:hypothetical protein
MKIRAYNTVTINGYTFKTFSDNNETIVSKNGLFCCVLDSLDLAKRVFLNS